MKKSQIVTEQQWLACGYCSLAFSSLEEYQIHATKNHNGRKLRLPNRIAQQTEEFN
jgi:hypothetical protein